MEGTTELQLQAKLKRSKIILSKRFKEPNFKYMGDTVVIFDVRQCFGDQKEELLRKAQKRRARSVAPTDQSRKVLRNNRKRFRTVYDKLYQQSLKRK
ncbi:MAG: hypothetical protein SGILL_009104 [Bacillariaceae sp.]